MRTDLRGLLTALVLAPLAAAPSSADVVTLNSGKDNTLYESSTGALSNGSGPQMFAGRTFQVTGLSLRRALVWFDVAGALPAGAFIDSASITLFQNQGASPDSVRIHPVLASWGQGASISVVGGDGRGAPATVGDATWLHRFHPDLLWTTPGGDFDPVAVGTGGGALSSNQLIVFKSSPELVTLVRGWQSSPDANHGVMVRVLESLPGSAKRFYTKEYVVPEPGYRPLMRVVYSLPVPAVPASWGRIKGVYR